MTATNKEVKKSTYQEVVSAESFSTFMKKRWDARGAEGEMLVLGETTIKVGDSVKLTEWISKKKDSTVQFGPFSLAVAEGGIVFKYNGKSLLTRVYTTVKQLFMAVWDILVYLSCKAYQGLVWLWDLFTGLFSKKDESVKEESTKAPAVNMADGEAKASPKKK